MEFPSNMTPEQFQQFANKSLLDPPEYEGEIRPWVRQLCMGRKKWEQRQKLEAIKIMGDPSAMAIRKNWLEWRAWADSNESVAKRKRILYRQIRCEAGLIQTEWLLDKMWRIIHKARWKEVLSELYFDWICDEAPDGEGLVVLLKN
jgi:hypothetical protein